MATQSDAERWRDKYLTLLEQHEQASEQAATAQARLRRALVMVSLLAEGQGSELDGGLRQLRETLRKDGHAEADADKRLPEALLEQLERMIRQSESSTQQHSQRLLEQLHNACETLLQAPLPGPLRKQVRLIRKRSRQSWQDVSAIREQLGLWLRLAQDLAAAASSNAEANSWLGHAGEWVGRWFGQRRIHNPQPGGTADTTAEPGFSHISREVTSTLQGLMQRLVIPAHQQGRAKELNLRLQQDLNWYELVPVLEQTSELVIACIATGQQGMEQFLHHLDQHLQQLQALVGESACSRQQERDTLGLLLTERVEDIRSLVTGGDDLALMGARIQQQLHDILAAMSHFTEQEQQREAQLQNQLAQMQSRLTTMEQESHQTMKQLARQRHQALHDALTGLPNRAAWQERNRRDWQLLQQGQTLVLAIADIDHFKRFNDTWGHQTGDRVLQLVAKTLRQQLPKAAFLARFGGEEFVLLRTGADLARVMAEIETVRQAIESVPWHFQGQRVSVTLSFGVAMAVASDTPEQLFQRADQALYQAKANGRNRTEQASPP
jgi:diguanylate cyclase